MCDYDDSVPGAVGGNRKISVSEIEQDINYISDWLAKNFGLACLSRSNAELR